MPPSKNKPAEADVEEIKDPVEETPGEQAPDADQAPVEEAPIVEAPAADPVEETPAASEAETVAEPMPAKDFLAQKGVFETTVELLDKIKAMPEGAEKEEAKAMFEKAMKAELSMPAEPVVKSGGRLVRVRRFFGSFHDAVFMEDSTKEWGEARNVSDATLEALRSEYAGAEIQVIEE